MGTLIMRRRCGKVNEEPSVIIYTASAKLAETDDEWTGGLHANAFNKNIVSHTFDNGVGAIMFDGSVTSIGSNAFYFCEEMESVTIPSSVTSIGDYAFSICTMLHNMTIPNSVKSIGEFAFQDCIGMSSITIPSSVISIGRRAFVGAKSITSMTVDSNNAIYDSRNNCNAIIKKANNQLILGCSTTSIPSSVTSIGDSAFADCSSLTSITIPNSVTSIGEYSFNWCDGLTSINIPNSVTSIGDYAFGDCTRLTNITIPNSVTYLGRGFCSNCLKLESVTIQNGVTYLPAHSFNGCSKLTSIIIPNSVTQIYMYAFANCGRISNITIPSSVRSISSYAFGACRSLTSIICNATTAPSIQTDTFKNVMTGGTLTVPSGSTGYNTWMGTGNYYLGLYNWTKVEVTPPLEGNALKIDISISRFTSGRKINERVNVLQIGVSYDPDNLTDFKLLSREGTEIVLTDIRGIDMAYGLICDGYYGGNYSYSFWPSPKASPTTCYISSEAL